MLANNYVVFKNECGDLMYVFKLNPIGTAGLVCKQRLPQNSGSSVPPTSFCGGDLLVQETLLGSWVPTGEFRGRVTPDVRSFQHQL